MYRLLLTLMLAALFAGPAEAQEAEPDFDTIEGLEDAAPDDEPAAAEEPMEAEEPEFDEAGLDVQGFEDLDDDFRPSEEIPADQSIEFPTDI